MLLFVKHDTDGKPVSGRVKYSVIDERFPGMPAITLTEDVDYGMHGEIMVSYKINNFWDHIIDEGDFDLVVYAHQVMLDGLKNEHTNLS